MGQIQIITPEQKVILDRIGENKFIRENFYFTGGTALSAYYLQHRFSEDLDLFSEKKFDNQLVYSFIESLSKKLGLQFTSEAIQTVYMFYLSFPNKTKVKVDFNLYPYRRIERGAIKDGISVDSLLDIAVNKLLTITQRNDVKDFVDFYFLEPKFGVWDLIEGVKVKFHQKIEPYLLASDFLKMDDFDVLPRMIKPINLDELKNFFRQKAQEVGKKAVY